MGTEIEGAEGPGPAVELVRLADAEGNRVSVSVLGRHPAVRNGLAAELVLDTPFVRGRLELSLWRSRLEAWGRALDRLEAGHDITWMGVERGPSLSVRLVGERGCPEVIVVDDLVSMVTVRVPVDLPDDWIVAHRGRLRALMAGWGMSGP
ncbi:DUF5959 family protein [Streptomyces sp. NPDC048636]|uniref:DUF5959 family protein n=1 Tax=Streptomyces sp. NPDC048636 TaxID=3155762 RepID=UPI003412BC7C